MGEMKTTEYYERSYPIKITILCRYDVKISHVLVMVHGICRLNVKKVNSNKFLVKKKRSYCTIRLILNGNMERGNYGKKNVGSRLSAIIIVFK